jgi:hypothetical protein
MKNPFVEQGTYTLLDVENANKVGMIASDPYLDKVEFLYKFEEVNGSQNFKNSIPNDKWFWIRETFNKAGKSGGFGQVSNVRSKFGNSCYFNSTSENSTGVFSGNGLFYNALVDLGKEDFTIECWLYLTTLGQNNGQIFVFNNRASASSPDSREGSYGGVSLYIDSVGRLYGPNGNTSSTPFTINTWHHVAMVRRDGIFRVFVDGTASFSSATSANSFATSTAESLFDLASCNLKVFNFPISNSVYADELRFTRKIARYWENFTAPTAEFPEPKQINNNGIVGLFKFNDSSVIKNYAKRGKDIVRLATQIATTDKRFGISSLQPDTYCSFHHLDPSSKLNASDFNISCWIKSSNINGGTVNNSPGHPIFSLNNDLTLIIGGGQWSNKSGIGNPNEGRLSLNYNNGNIICQTDVNSIQANTWHHVLVSRNSGVYRIFIDGVLKSTSFIWKATSAPVSNRWSGIAYGNGTFCAVGGFYSYEPTNSNYTSSNGINSNVSVTSTDGITWTQGTLPASIKWSNIVYGDKFVAISFENNIVATSEDGVNWSTSTMPSFNYNTKAGVETQTAHRWSSIAYGGGTYVALTMMRYNNIGSSVATSTDGITWTARSISDDIWTDLLYVNNQFIAIGLNGKISTSSDGIGWTTITATSPQNNSIDLDFTTMSYGNGFYLAFSSSAALERRYVYTSNNLQSWTRVNLPYVSSSMVDISKILFANGEFYLFNTVNNLVVKTSDGINFQYIKIANPVGKNNIIYANNKFVSLGRMNAINTNVGNNSDINDYNFNQHYLIIGGKNTSTLNDNIESWFYQNDNLTSITSGFANARWTNTRMTGYIDEFIIDKNTGISSNFSVPTQSLPDTRYIY